MRVIIHMGDAYPNESPCAKRMGTLYEALKQHSHVVTILAPVDSESDIPDVIGYKSIPLKSKSSINRLLNQISSGINSVKASKKCGDADIVLTTTPPALFSIFGWKIAKRKKALLVYDVRDIWPDVAWEMGSFSPRSLYSRVFEWNRNFMLKHSDCVFAVSKGKVDKLKHYNSEAVVELFSNGLDENFLTNEDKISLVQQYDLDSVYTCVYFGNLGLAQGLLQLLHIAKRALESNLRVQFLLFGSGVEEQKLKDYAVNENLTNVLFPGRIKNENMYSILKHSGMSFVSLVNDKLTDSVPTKMFEALGVGCPVLLAASGESVDILNQCGLGRAVKPNDEEALWNAFCDIYENRTSFDDIREEAINFILSNYSRQKISENMVSYFERILK